MDEQQLNDDSHYEISLTATQAFVAFVLLLLSLAAAFAFGVMVGRGQLDPAAVAKSGSGDAAVITERPMPAAPVETATEAVEEAKPEEQATNAGDAIESASEATTTAPVATTATPVAPAVAPATTAVAQPASVATPASTGPAWAQLLATSDAKRAETLAAKLIDGGFTSAFVDRIKGEKGTIHRVRVRFKSEAEARAAVPKLQPYTTEKVLVTTK